MVVFKAVNRQLKAKLYPQPVRTTKVRKLPLEPDSRHAWADTGLPALSGSFSEYVEIVKGKPYEIP